MTVNESIKVILFVICIFFYLTKIRMQFKYYYAKESKNYPGFLKAYFDSTFINKFLAFSPLPILEETGDTSLKKKVAIALAGFVLSLIAFFFFPL